MANTKQQQLDDWEDADDWQDVGNQPAPPPEEPSLQGGAVRSAMDWFSPGFTKGAVRGAVQEGSLDNIQLPADPTESPLGNAAGRGAAMLGQSALVGPLVGAGKTAAARVGISGLANAGLGFARKPEEDTLENRGIGALISGGLGVAGQGLGEGASRLGDWLMQKAVSMKNYVPGAGKELANQGVIGTKGMMQNQVAKALPEQEAALQKAVNSLEGVIEPDDIAEAVSNRAKGYIPAPGSSGPLPVPEQNKPFVDAALNRANEVMGRGNLSPSEALNVSRAIAKPAYGMTGEPLNSFKNKLSQTEAGSIKDALKSLGDAQDVPGVRQSLASEAALIKASKGLNKPENLASVLSRSALKAAIGGGAGYQMGGKEGAVAGAALSTPLGLSSMGRAAIGAGKAAPYVTPALIDALRGTKRKER